MAGESKVWLKQSFSSAAEQQRRKKKSGHSKVDSRPYDTILLKPCYSGLKKQAAVMGSRSKVLVAEGLQLL